MDSSSMAVGVTVFLLVVGWIAITVALHTSLREPGGPPATRDGDDTVRYSSGVPGVFDQRPHVRPAPTGSINPRSRPLVRRPRGARPRLDKDRTRRA